MDRKRVVITPQYTQGKYLASTVRGLQTDASWKAAGEQLESSWKAARKPLEKQLEKQLESSWKSS